jgi:hypothetical protein
VKPRVLRSDKATAVIQSAKTSIAFDNNLQETVAAYTADE